MSDCTTCAEYDGDKGYCPKYCEVIRRTLEELARERSEEDDGKEDDEIVTVEYFRRK